MPAPADLETLQAKQKSSVTSDNAAEYALFVQPNGMFDVSAITCP